MYNPYEWIREDLSYTFETDNGVTYLAYFENISSLFGDHALGFPIFTFNIEIVSFSGAEKSPPDPRIADTIYDILARYFSSDERTLVVFYDTIDGKSDARKRKFDYWFQKYSIDDVEKRDYIAIDEGVAMPSSLLVHYGHPYKNLLFEVYQRIVDNGGYLE